ncbi:TetR/AcrR family transcriptional regulator [Corynebacterium doosanense]|uniref:HTH tetR-type domain-containing protein n=1 Tax=Corynebacterium doosanense CAU 212 = DSM 45436 TaxID=558173 RepID=A0A097IJJ1_9CORY|nr:TetR/AcrR family transcriptional regulator [Corynebacterium doosanense]AIT62316.1 hypothetical protein CDOO_10660 [Corynebacterium doosanense CAU 212 = DSM 45436]
MSAQNSDRRSAVLAAVWGVIAERGIDGVSFRSVAREAGVSTGLVQHHFPTRADLIRESARWMIDSASASYPATRDVDDDTAVTELLTHALPSASQSPRGVGIYYAFLATAATDAVVREVLREAKDGARDEIARRLRIGTLEAAALLALSDGLVQQAYLGAISPEAAVSVISREVERARKNPPLE